MWWNRTVATTPAAPTPEHLIERFGLAPHPEGGWFVETWRGPPGEDGRSIGTSILFLLRAGERSHWHRVDATEIWHHHAGEPLLVEIAPEAEPRSRVTIGDVSGGHEPLVIVPTWAWQAATPMGDWALVGCTVTPGFRFEGFELAPPNWTP